MADFVGIQVNNADVDDLRAAQHIVGLENERRAALDPPEAALPDSTNAELKASYESMLLSIIADAHASYKKQAADKAASDQSLKDLWKAATDAERAAAITALGG